MSEVFRPRWADTLGTQGWTGTWLDHVRAQNTAMFAPASNLERMVALIASSSVRSGSISIRDSYPTLSCWTKWCCKRHYRF